MVWDAKFLIIYIYIYNIYIKLTSIYNIFYITIYIFYFFNPIFPICIYIYIYIICICIG